MVFCYSYQAGEKRKKKTQPKGTVYFVGWCEYACFSIRKLEKQMMILAFFHLKRGEADDDTDII